MIKAQSINKIYDLSGETFYALRDISFEIKTAELVILQGKSGSGKSTLLSIIASTLKPSSGGLYVDGENIVSYSEYFASRYRQKKVGVITQDFHLFDLLSVKENIEAALIVSEFSQKEIDKKVLDVAKICNIEHKLNMSANTLSGGEKQRCIIARAIVNNPSIILCDEPTANLDTSNANIFINILKNLKKDGKTIIVATHDPIFEQLPFVDKLFYMKDARLKQSPFNE
jgi:putative ABC transport system ATP-binding protein